MRLVLILTLVVTGLFGQEVDSYTTSYLDSLMMENVETLIIQENRLSLPFSDNSRSIELITNRDIQQLNPTSINELLQIVAGVDVRQRGVNGVQADVSIRGGTFEQTLILLNGVRLLDPQTGHHMMNIPVSVSAIERIEIIKGPAARIYGQNAFAGAINIVTKAQDETAVSLMGEYGQNDLANLFASVSLPVGNYKQTLSGSFNTSDGYRYNTDYEIANVFYQSQLDLGTTSLDLMAGHVDRKFGANGFYGSETFTEQYEEVVTSFISLGSQIKAGEWRVKPRVSYRRNKDNWQFDRADPNLFQNFHTTQVVTGEVHISRSHSLGQLGVGVEYNYLHLDSSNLKDSSGNGLHTRNQIGLHLENRFLFANEKLDVTPGILILEVEGEELNFLPGVDVGLALNNNFKLFANVGWTTRVPTFTDLFYEDRGNVGNPNLQRESAFTAEFGIKKIANNFNFQASVFSREATDQIDWFRVNEEDKWTPDNFNSASYRGFDFSTTYNFNSIKFINSLRVGYTYLNADFEETDFAFSRNVLENLRHQFILSPNFSVGPVALNVVLKYNDRVSLEDYVTVNTYLSAEFGKYTAFIKANNLFDEIYRETNLVEMPGRWISFGSKLDF